MIKLYRKYFKHFKRHLIIGPIFKLIEAIFELLVPLVIARMINVGLNENKLDKIDHLLYKTDLSYLVSKSDRYNYILIMGGILFLFAIVGLCSALICQYLASRASQGIGTMLRDDLYTHINTLSYKELDRFSQSTLLTRMNQDINNLQQGAAMLIRLVVRAPFLMIGATVLSFIVSIKAGTIFLSASILLALVIFIVMRISIPISKRAQKSLDDVTTITKENLSGNRVIRAYNRQKYEYNRFVDNNISLTKINVLLGRVNALLNPMTFIITNIAIVILLYLGGNEFKIGNLNQGDLTSLYDYFIQIQLAVIVVASLVVLYTKASTSAGRINEVFNTTSSIRFGIYDKGTNEDVVISFDNVSFSYNGSVNSVSNLSFEIKKGMSVGIIGSTASGKSTIINLINRFYDVSDGSLYLYGRNIKEYKESFIRDNISLVSQKASLFSGTIKENILWGKENATDEEIISSLKMSQAYDFVSNMEKGIDTFLYQGGKNLSGGQRQRLSIARGLIKDSNILILDDTYSALDFKTESNLRAEISKLDKTVITISQRVSSISNCDLILVIDNGKIVGMGTHDNLIKDCSVYKEISDSQDYEGGNC